jgi:membrane protease subunit (stomatin/prohibitin family)
VTKGIDFFTKSGVYKVQDTTLPLLFELEKNTNANNFFSISKLFFRLTFSYHFLLFGSLFESNFSVAPIDKIRCILFKPNKHSQEISFEQKNSIRINMNVYCQQIIIITNYDVDKVIFKAHVFTCRKFLSIKEFFAGV